MSNIPNLVSLGTKMTSKISPTTRLILVISIFIALSIAIIVLILSFLYKKRVIKKYLSPKEETEILKLEEINPNYGIVLDGIKKYYDSIQNDFLTCFLINTIYLNNFNKVYIEDKNNYLALSISNLAKKEVFFNGNNNPEINQKIKKEFSDLDFSNIKQTKKLNEVYDFIISLNSNCNNLSECIKEKKDFIATNGILLIENEKNFKLSKIKEVASFYALRYEVLKFKNKNVILLAKNNIKEIIDKKEN